MRVFVTGATGFIGSRVVPQLIAAGHSVLGLTRSDAGAEQLKAAGADVHRGDIYDIESIKSGAKGADAVVHLAFNHDFTTFAANCETDRKVIDAIGEVLASSANPAEKVFLVTGGVGITAGKPGHLRTEDDAPMATEIIPRAASEHAARAIAEKGVRVGMVRLPQVHDPYKQGLVPYITKVAIAHGYAPYVGEGKNRWAAAAVDDVALLYRLAVEKTPVGFTVYNAVGEEGVTMRAIAESLARGLKIETKSITAEDAPAHFGPLAHFALMDMPASSKKTQTALGWTPTGPTLLEDLDQGKFVSA